VRQIHDDQRTCTSMPSIVVLTLSLRMTSSFLPSVMTFAGTLNTAILLWRLALSLL